MGKKPKEEVKVIIGLPCLEMMKSKTAHAIGNLIMQDRRIIDFLMIQSCDIASNRMWLVKEAKRLGATHLLFIDSDMLFPPTALETLLSRGKDIIGVEYNKRTFPLQTVTAYMPDVEKSETEPFKVGIAGTGFLLIKLSIFDDPNMDKNWFSFGRNAEGKNVIGEDGWFCNTARSAGYDIYVDPSIRVLHLGEYGF